LEAHIAKESPEYGLWLGLTIPIALLLFIDAPKIERDCWAALMIAAGIYVSRKQNLYLKAPATMHEGVLRGLIVVFGLVAVDFLWLADAPIALRASILALWVSLFASPICRSFRFAK
jgi:hypothetical protein